jgi:NAD(P)-dependent dehydrogenase (short-subunit alcohol dehydrogenase family)
VATKTITSKQRLKGKVAIITGSGRGIGRSEALIMAREGAKIVVNDIGVDDGVARAEAVAAEIRANGGEAIASQHDISTANGARDLIAAGVEAFGGLDILVNNAGLRAAGRIEDITEEEFDAVVGSHLKASWLTIKFAVPEFRKRGGGHIINTGSESGFGMPFNGAYAAAKEGIAGLTRTVARELGSERIRCNTILPRASIGTGGGKWSSEEHSKRLSIIEALGPYWLGNRGLTLKLGDVFDPVHVGEFVTWLATDAAIAVNGAAFYVGGDEIGLVSEPDVVSSIVRPGGWSVEEFERYGGQLIAQETDRFLIDLPVGAT